MPEKKEKRRIKPVEGNKDKQRTYQEQLGRYKKAIQNSFFLEAIVIDYACMEDRLRYMLYYLGVLKSEDDISIKSHSARAKEFRSILREYSGSEETLRISTITGKMKIVTSVFQMASDFDKTAGDNDIRKILCSALHQDEHISEMMSILQEIGTWCKYRNEIIHSLMNKNMDSLYEQIGKKAEEGNLLFRRLDKQVQWVKRKNIREKLGL